MVVVVLLVNRKGAVGDGGGKDHSEPEVYSVDGIDVEVGESMYTVVVVVVVERVGKS